MRTKSSVLVVKDDWPPGKPYPVVDPSGICVMDLSFDSFTERQVVVQQIEDLMATMHFGEPDGSSIIGISEAFENSARTVEKKVTWRRIHVKLIYEPSAWFYVIILDHAGADGIASMRFNDLPPSLNEGGRGAYIIAQLSDVILVSAAEGVKCKDMLIGFYRWP